MKLKHVDGDRPWSDLAPKQKQFVLAYIDTGDAYAAMVSAGYVESSITEERAKAMRDELARHIDEQTQLRVRSSDNAIFAMQHLKKLVLEADSEQVRYNAAKEILSRTEAAKPDDRVVEHRHKHEVAALSDKQLLREIKKLQKELGGFVIEGTATHVETEERATLPPPQESA